MIITPKRLIKAFKKLGCIEIRQVGSHKTFLNPRTGRKATVPFHGRDLPVGTFNNILKQIGITENEIRKVLLKEK